MSEGTTMAGIKKILTTLPVLAVGALAVVATTATTREAAAQEIQLTGPLKGAPAVRRLRLYREGRIEFAPSFTSTILDEYKRTLLVGARINYGITDWLAIGVWGAYGAVGVSTGLTDQIEANTKRDGLTQMNVGNDKTGNFKSQVAQIQYIAMPQLTAIPFRGKFALFQSVFADVDAYLFAGFGVVGTKERADCANFITCAGNHQQDSKNHLAPTWGLGFNFYLNGFMALGFEYRMIPFAWNRSGFDSRGLDADGNQSDSGKFPDGKIDNKDQTYKFNQMLSIFLGFSFPSKPKITD
jgi:outer membrane beta-barrel protein